ncbi:restriction endonuclease subunit S [Clostridium sp. VAP23]|uniref:restriction endonuclease subunit S n=1 Tax=Clostridium sp. VAP23 TaxID=2949981 RepID=UPI00207A1E23|nr:restriction endonuclease subunit S [Clostridium sp. VAP23]
MNEIILKLKDVCEINGGYAFKSLIFKDDGVPLIRIGDIFDNKVNITNTTVYVDVNIKDYKKFIIDKGDILIALSGATTGKFGIYNYNEKSLLNQRVAKIKPKNNMINNKYLYHYINKLKNNIYNNALGCAQPNISPSEISEMSIYVPNILIQEKIANVLDKAQELIDKRKAQIEALDELVKSQFIEMFGDPVLNTKGWRKRKFEEYIEFLTSGSRGWASYFSDNGEMFLTIKNVKNNGIQTDNMQYVVAPNTQEAKRTKVREGDLLISITADLGRTGVVSKEIEEFGAYINQHLSLVRLDKKRVNPLFISYFLESEGGKIQFDSKNQVGVKSGLNFTAIKSLNILVPPIEEQNKFIEFIKQIDKLKFEMQNSLKELEDNFNSLMQRAFKGELFN